MQLGGRLRNQGFTLIELSIALVIIGLIVGGILVGQDLIKSAETRAQIAQIEKYNAAVHAFQNKYGGLPGDLQLTIASQFGFEGSDTTCNGATGKRNGDGVITGHAGEMGILSGESGLFWQDLSAAGTIDEVFPNSGATSVYCGALVSLTLTPGTTYVGDFFPKGKIGYGTFLYVYNSQVNGTGNINWFGLSAVQSISGNAPTGLAGITVTQSYNIDKKVDDGLPTTGWVQAQYLNNSTGSIQTPTTAPADNTATCYNTTSYTYSTNATNGGNGQNCALSFQFK